MTATDTANVKEQQQQGIEWVEYQRRGSYQHKVVPGTITIGKAHMTLSPEDLQKIGGGPYIKILEPKDESSRGRFFAVVSATPDDINGYRLGHNKKKGSPASASITSLIQKYGLKKGKYPARWLDARNALVVDLSERIQ